jgi:hypothetical protein
VDTEILDRSTGLAQALSKVVLEVHGSVVTGTDDHRRSPVKR